MVYYTDSPSVNKRAVAGYYLFLCLIGFAILLGPTGSGIPVTIVGDSNRYEHDLSAPDNDTYSLDSCATCHPNEHGNWSGTEHATAAQWYVNGTGAYPYIIPGVYMSNASFAYCAECHATDVDGDGTWDTPGVTCFSCHNMTSPWVDYSGDTCGAVCHTGELGEDAEHPHQYLIWQNSAHANSLTDLRGSSHASDYCMHCMSTEGFVHQQNPDMLADTNPAVNLTFDPSGDYNSIGCPACHAVHANWSAGSPAMIRAVNASELCGLCHVGGRHPTYQVWIGGSHNLAGVECIDCHGYALHSNGTDIVVPFLNHTFAVIPDLACGQSEECHEGMETWALGQLEMYQDSYEALTEEIETEAAALEAIVLAYNATDGADHELVAEVLDMLDDATGVVSYYNYDGSEGFHDPIHIFADLNEALRDVVEAKAYFYENMPAETITETVTETITVTETVPGTLFGFDPMMVLIGGSVGGIVIGLILGLVVGRR